MTIEDLKSRVSEIISRDDCSAEFFFLIDNNDGMNVKSAEIVDGDHMELEALFIASVSDSILLDDNLSLIELSSADDRRDALYRYDLEEIPSQLKYLKEIIENETFETFDFAKDSLSHLEGILILLGNEESQIAIYKHQYPVSLMKKDSGVFNLMKPNGGNRFKKLDADILKINQRFEFFKVDGQYYILDIKALERFFGFHEAVKNVAIQGLDNIIETGLVENHEVFKDRIDEISFARKLVKAASKSPVLGQIPNEQVINFTNNHPALKGKFKYSDDGSQINLGTKRSQDLFLKLINDDFLQSELTKLYYESVAKDSIEESEKAR